MKVILCGSSGKMGKEVYQELLKNNIEVVYQVDENTLPLSKVINKQTVDYILDFTNSEIGYQHILLAINNNISFISGTTGFSKKQISVIKNLIKQKTIKGLICPNFSFPLNIIINNIDTIASNFEEIIYDEYHHYSKKDFPSGTAKLIKEKCPRVIINSYKKDDYIITYHLTFKSKCDTMEIDYKVDNKKVYAKGLIYCLKNNDLFYNLLNEGEKDG